MPVSRRTIRLQYLGDEPVSSLAASSANRALRELQLAQAGVALEVTHETAHIQALIGMVEAGLRRIAAPWRLVPTIRIERMTSRLQGGCSTS